MISPFYLSLSLSGASEHSANASSETPSVTDRRRFIFLSPAAPWSRSARPPSGTSLGTWETASQSCFLRGGWTVNDKQTARHETMMAGSGSGGNGNGGVGACLLVMQRFERLRLVSALPRHHPRVGKTPRAGTHDGVLPQVEQSGAGDCEAVSAAAFTPPLPAGALHETTTVRYQSPDVSLLQHHERSGRGQEPRADADWLIPTERIASRCLSFPPCCLSAWNIYYMIPATYPERPPAPALLL